MHAVRKNMTYQDAIKSNKVIGHVAICTHVDFVRVLSNEHGVNKSMYW